MRLWKLSREVLNTEIIRLRRTALTRCFFLSTRILKCPTKNPSASGLTIRLVVVIASAGVFEVVAGGAVAQVKVEL